MALTQIRIYDQHGISILRESLDGPDGYDVVTIADDQHDAVTIPVELAEEVAQAILKAARH